MPPLLLLVLFAFLILNLASVSWSQAPNISFLGGLMMGATVMTVIAIITILNTTRRIKFSLFAYLFGGYILIIGVFVSLLSYPEAGAGYGAFYDFDDRTGPISRNKTGTYIAFGVPLAWFLMRNPVQSIKKRIQSGMALGYIISAYPSIILTSSRQSFVLLTIATLYILYTLRTNFIKYKFSPIGTILILLAVYLFVPRDALNRATNIYEPVANLEGNVRSRYIDLTQALEMWESRPILGYGFNTFSEILDTGARNTWIVVSFELGIIGLLLQFLIIFVHFAYVCSDQVQNSRELWLTILLLILASSTIRDLSSADHFYFLLSISAAAAMNSWERESVQ